MFKFLRKLKGQSTLEYAVLIIIVIGALLAIQNYVKRGLQGRIKQATDDIGEQYSPSNTNVSKTTKTTGRTWESFQDGATNSYLLNNETTTTTGFSRILNLEYEFWGQKKK